MTTPLTDEQQIKNLYAEMWQALQTKDIDELEKIHADEFILVHMTGMKQTKAEYLESVREGRLNYFSEEVENIFVEVKGASAAEKIFGDCNWHLKLKNAAENGCWFTARHQLIKILEEYLWSRENLERRIFL